MDSTLRAFITTFLSEKKNTIVRGGATAAEIARAAIEAKIGAGNEQSIRNAIKIESSKAQTWILAKEIEDKTTQGAARSFIVYHLAPSPSLESDSGLGATFIAIRCTIPLRSIQSGCCVELFMAVRLKLDLYQILNCASISHAVQQSPTAAS